jgi:hypothetical protein
VAGVSFDGGNTFITNSTIGAIGSGATYTSAVFTGGGILAGSGLQAIPPPPFTIYHIGNSLTADLYYDFRSVGTAYEATLNNGYSWGYFFRPSTSLTYLYNNPTDTSGLIQSAIGMTANSVEPSTNTNPWTNALPGNRWNVVTMEPFKDFASGSTDIETLGTDTTSVSGFIAATRSNPANASTRFYIYATWADVIYDTAPITLSHTNNANTQWLSDFTTATTNTPSQPGIITRYYSRFLCDNARTNNSGISIHIIPVGEVFYTLTQMMLNSQFDGLTNIDELHRDTIHLDSVGQNIASWTAYATIFRQSPVGLPLNILGNGVVSPFVNVTNMDDHDRLLIQQTIWNVVTNLNYYTGVAIPLNIQTSGSDMILTWVDPSYSLQVAATVTGAYTNVSGAASPYTNTVSGSQNFFRLQSN